MLRVLLISLLFVAPSASAEPYTAGDRIEPFSLDDQHGETHQVDAAVAILLFSRDMPGGDVLKAALMEKVPDLALGGKAEAKKELGDRGGDSVTH